MTPQEWIVCVREAAEQLENLEFLQEGATHLAAALEEIAKLKEEAEMWKSLAKEWLHEIHRKPALDDVRKLHAHVRVPGCVHIEHAKPGEYWIDLDMMADRIKVTDGLEIISAEEIARLRAEAGRVVVPELTPDGMSTAAFVEGYHFAASRAHSVPFSRVLKDGEVAVDAEEWAAMCDLGFDPEPCRLDHHGCCQEHNWFSEKPCPTAILQRLYALRTQATATESSEKGGTA